MVVNRLADARSLPGCPRPRGSRLFSPVRLENVPPLVPFPSSMVVRPVNPHGSPTFWTPAWLAGWPVQTLRTGDPLLYNLQLGGGTRPSPLPEHPASNLARLGPPPLRSLLDPTETERRGGNVAYGMDGPPPPGKQERDRKHENNVE